MKDTETIMYYAILWIILSAVVGLYAKTQQRNAIGYMFLSFFITPIWSFIILSIVGKKKRVGGTTQVPKVFGNHQHAVSAFGGAVVLILKNV